MAEVKEHYGEGPELRASEASSREGEETAAVGQENAHGGKELLSAEAATKTPAEKEKEIVDALLALGNEIIELGIKSYRMSGSRENHKIEKTVNGTKYTITYNLTPSGGVGNDTRAILSVERGGKLTLISAWPKTSYSKPRLVIQKEEGRNIVVVGGNDPVYDRQFPDLLTEVRQYIDDLKEARK